MISLLKLITSIHELPVLIPFLESILILPPEQIANPGSIPIPEPILIPESGIGSGIGFGICSVIGSGIDSKHGIGIR